jgi:hypothetical protein
VKATERKVRQNTRPKPSTLAVFPTKGVLTTAATQDTQEEEKGHQPQPNPAKQQLSNTTIINNNAEAVQGGAHAWYAPHPKKAAPYAPHVIFTCII